MISDVWESCRDQEQWVWGLFKELWDCGQQGLGVARLGWTTGLRPSLPWESFSGNIIKLSKMVGNITAGSYQGKVILWKRPTCFGSCLLPAGTLHLKISKPWAWWYKVEVSPSRLLPKQILTKVTYVKASMDIAPKNLRAQGWAKDPGDTTSVLSCQF